MSTQFIRCPSVGFCYGLGFGQNNRCQCSSCSPTMTSAPHQRDDSDAVDSRPMLSPIRTSLPASNGSSVNNSTRLPFFADQTSANVWPTTQHFASSGPQSSSSGLVHASLDQPSYHSHHHQQPQSFVSSNIHEFTPHPDMGINASSDPRFNQSLSPVDNNSALQQQQQPPQLVVSGKHQACKGICCSRSSWGRQASGLRLEQKYCRLRPCRRVIFRGCCRRAQLPAQIVSKAVCCMRSMPASPVECLPC